MDRQGKGMIIIIVINMYIIFIESLEMLLFFLN